jgi:hypothetical protein
MISSTFKMMAHKISKLMPKAITPMAMAFLICQFLNLVAVSVAAADSGDSQNKNVTVPDEDPKGISLEKKLVMVISACCVIAGMVGLGFLVYWKCNQKKAEEQGVDRDNIHGVLSQETFEKELEKDRAERKEREEKAQEKEQEKEQEEKRRQEKDEKEKDGGTSVDV